MCVRSPGAFSTARCKARLTAQQSNGYIGGLTVRCRKDKPPMDRHFANRRRATPAPRCSMVRRSVIIVVNVACGALVASACSSRLCAPSRRATDRVRRRPPRYQDRRASGSTKGPASTLAHAECMRSHGVPDFPDPGPIHIDVGTHPDLDPSSPAFVAAQKACLSLQPGGTAGITVSPQMQAAALAYSACMRSHGFPKFRRSGFRQWRRTRRDQRDQHRRGAVPKRRQVVSDLDRASPTKWPNVDGRRPVNRRASGIGLAVVATVVLGLSLTGADGEAAPPSADQPAVASEPAAASTSPPPLALPAPSTSAKPFVASSGVAVQLNFSRTGSAHCGDGEGRRSRHERSGVGVRRFDCSTHRGHECAGERRQGKDCVDRLDARFDAARAGATEPW